MIYELEAIWISIKLALITMAILLLIGTPLAWWLANSSSRIKPFIEALVAMPLVLPPTVLGFYLLIILGPAGKIGSFWIDITGSSLTFSFTGLVIASVIYSLPFAVQPIQNSFESLGKKTLESASLLGASPIDIFFNIASPLSIRGYITAAVLVFAHTLGEFGVVLMVGGNIPGSTKVISIAIYENVETLNYEQAHILSLGLLIFSFVILLTVYTMNRKIPLNRCR